MGKIVTISGSPGAGKTTLCMNLTQTLASMEKPVFYAHEWVKDMANRKYNLSSIDQFMVFGNQTGLIASGVVSGVPLITSCTSPELCAFYAEYGSGFKGRYSSLVDAAKQFESECSEHGYGTKKVFLYRSHDLYRKYHTSVGRWQSVDESIKMQELMADWFTKHFTGVEIKQDIDVFSLIESISLEA